MNTLKKTYRTPLLALSAALLAACGAEDLPRDGDDPSPKIFKKQIGTDLNSKQSPLLSLNPGGPGGSPNQSQRAGDVLIAKDHYDNILIGGLGVDVLVGKSGDDIMIGGTEDFNGNVDGDNKGSDNRDRAFGNAGNDTFIWSPGDGSDFYDGGEGTDVLIFGLLGEERDSDGSVEGAPFFNVNPPNREGSQDFDGIFLDERNQPIVNVSGSPGFCSFVDTIEHADALSALNLDHITRFSLRGVANAFDAGENTEDDGLRVAISNRNVEYVVCTKREVTEDGGVNNIAVLDITTTPPTEASIADLPEYVQKMIR